MWRYQWSIQGIYSAFYMKPTSSSICTAARNNWEKRRLTQSSWLRTLSLESNRIVRIISSKMRNWFNLKFSYPQDLPKLVSVSRLTNKVDTVAPKRIKLDTQDRHRTHKRPNKLRNKPRFYSTKTSRTKRKKYSYSKKSTSNSSSSSHNSWSTEASKSIWKLNKQF